MLNLNHPNDASPVFGDAFSSHRDRSYLPQSKSPALNEQPRLPLMERNLSRWPSPQRRWGEKDGRSPHKR